MKYQLHRIYSLVFILLSVNVLAQNDSINNANKAYESLNYINAIDIYTSVVESGVKDPKLIHRLASAHYFNGNFDSAAKWYEEFYRMKGTNPTLIDNYRYGQVLKTQKKYKEADSLLSTYYLHKGLRYKSLLDSEKKEIFTVDNDDVYKLNEYQWNTDLSEYPAYINKNELFVVGYDLESKKKKSRRKKTSNLYRLDQATGKYTPLSEDVNSPYNEGPAVITNDGKTMFFSRNDYLKSRLKKSADEVVTINIYIAQFRNGQWKNVKPFPFNSEEYSVGHPALSLDNKTLYFVSNKPGGKGGTDLYKVTVFDDGTFGEPKNLVDINSSGNEMFPFVDKKDGSLYFSSNGPESKGGLDIFISKLTSDKTYKRAYNLGNQINSTYDDFSFMIGDNRKGFFASNRVNELGMDDIYSFKELQNFQTPLFVNFKGNISDYGKNLPLEGVKLKLFDKNNQELASTITNSDGFYEFGEIEASKVSYVRVEKDTYQPIEKNLTQDIIKENKPLRLNMLALGQKLPTDIIISGKLKDPKSGEALTKANVTLLDIDNNIIAKTETGPDGSYSFKNIPTDKVAFIKVEKKGYQTEEKEIDLTKIKNGEIVEKITISKNNVPVALGNDLASILNTIYFDLGKSEIRIDAQVELEKIVQVLKKFKSMSIQIESHTDSRGGYAINLKLSQSRALATYNYIVSKGIDPKRLKYKGFGASKLINKCKKGVKCSEEEHEFNRRSSFKILKI